MGAILLGMDTHLLDAIDPQVIGRKLQRARKQKGLTQLDAAQVIDAARTTITAIEKGERRVKAAELVKLAQAYGCQVSDFVRPRPELEPFDAQFRKAFQRTGAASDELAGCIAQFENLCRDYLELEQLAGAPLVYNYPAEVDLRHLPVQRAAEAAASAERSRLGLGDAPIHALRELLEQEVGLRIFYPDMAPAGLSALYAYGSDLGGAVAVNRLQREDQRRYALAHAYAHFLTNRRQAAVLRVDSDPRRPEREPFADGFAAHFLMPTNGVLRRCNAILRSQPNLRVGDLLALAGYFGVSATAMALRLQELDLLLPTAVEQSRSVFAVREAQAPYSTGPVAYDDLLPKRYQYLAVEAWQEEAISEGQLARFLHVNRLEAREVVELLRVDTNSLTKDSGLVLHA